MADDRYVPLVTGIQINRAIRSNWFIMLGFAPCLVIVSGVIGLFDAPLSRSLGVTPGDTAIVLDFTILVVIPLGVTIFRELYKLRRARRAQRQRFIEAHSGDRLVVSRYIPRMVYKVTGGDPDTGSIEIVAVWNVDRPVADGKAYLSKISALEPLVPERFVGE